MFCAPYITHSHSRRVTSTFLSGRWWRQPMGSFVPVNTLKHHLAAADMFMMEWGGARERHKNTGNDSPRTPIRRLGLSEKGGALSDNTHVSPHRVTSFLLMSYYTTIPLTLRCPVSRLFVLTNRLFSERFPPSILIPPLLIRSAQTY